MYKCSNCGALISEDSVHCPYCNGLNFEAAENEYMDNLEEINQRMDDLDDNAAAILKKSIRKRRIITAAIGIVFVFFGFLLARSDNIDSYYQKNDAELSTALNEYDEYIDALNLAITKDDLDEVGDILDKCSSKLYYYILEYKWEYFGYYNFYNRDYKYINSYITGKYKLNSNDSSSYGRNYFYCVRIFAAIKGGLSDSYYDVSDYYNNLEDQDIKARMDKMLDNCKNYVIDTLKVPEDVFLKDIDDYASNRNDEKQIEANVLQYMSN